VQIYTAQSPVEALELARAGVDHVGVTVSGRGLPGEVGMDVGKSIVSALQGRSAKCVALTVDIDLDAIDRFVTDLRPDIVHLCGDTSVVGPDEVSALSGKWKRSTVDVEVMQAIGVTGSESAELARAYADHVEWLILDSVTDDVEGIGAAGIVHDWRVSRQIVSEVSVPVILAGGLGPENVTAAIEAVRPAGVDSLTLTNRIDREGGFRKDLDAVRRFVARAKSLKSGW